jgi:transcription elongation factor Elf1
MEEIEKEFICPYCGENISMLLDLSGGRQQYIEDCEVCCRPIEINYTLEGESINSFSACPSDS